MCLQTTDIQDGELQWRVARFLDSNIIASSLPVELRCQQCVLMFHPIPNKSLEDLWQDGHIFEVRRDDLLDHSYKAIMNTDPHKLLRYVTTHA